MHFLPVRIQTESLSHPIKKAARKDTNETGDVTFILCVRVWVELLVHAWTRYSLLDVHVEHERVHQGFNNSWGTKEKK